MVTLRRGREKLHYLNAAPINLIAERWINHYDQSRVHALLDLKHALEGTPMTRPSFVYKTYINTTPEQLWQALTDPAFTLRYWDTTLESTWEVGATITWNNHGVVIADPDQVVLEYDPYRRLAYTWHTFTPELAARLRLRRPPAEAGRRRPLPGGVRPRARRCDGQAHRRARRLRRRQHRGRHGQRGLAPGPCPISRRCSRRRTCRPGPRRPSPGPHRRGALAAGARQAAYSTTGTAPSAASASSSSSKMWTFASYSTWALARSRASSSVLACRP